MVDSSDRLRLKEARDTLLGVIKCDSMRAVPITVIASKQDLPDAMGHAEIIAGLQLHTMRGHKWHVQAASAASGQGIYESLHATAMLVEQSKANNV